MSKANNRLAYLIAFLMVIFIGVLAPMQLIIQAETPSFSYSFDEMTETPYMMQTETEDTYDYTIRMEDFPEYKFVSENDSFVLYLNDTNHHIGLQVKETGYVWFSMDPRYHGTKKEFLSSLIMTFVQVSVANVKYLSELLPEEYTIQYEMNPNGFTMHVDLLTIFISFDIEVWIDDESLHYKMPHESIVETSNLRLFGIHIFPLFGATTGVGQTGYMFLPDGSGSLIRYNNNITGKRFVKSIYGDDYGYDEIFRTTSFKNVVPTADIKIPVIGMVHGVQKNAFIAIASEGSEYAEIIADNRVGSDKVDNVPWSFYTNGFRFVYRRNYFRPMKDDPDKWAEYNGGMSINSLDFVKVDIGVTFRFLSNDEADYVGMAKDYRSYLDFKTSEINHETNDIPLYVDFIGQEVVKGLFTLDELAMTSYDEALNILQDLDNRHVSNWVTNIQAKENDGDYFFGVGDSLGNQSQFETLQTYIDNHQSTLSMSYDYFFRFNAEYNVATQLGGIPIRLPTKSDVYDFNYFMDNIEMKVSESQILEQMQTNGLNIAFDATGKVAYTHYNRKQEFVLRNEFINQITEILESVQQNEVQMTFNNPNSYAYRYATNVTNVPVSTSGYSYQTDTIPFIELVLSNQANMFSAPLNFIANRNLYLLRMVEYGLYPNYLLTAKDAYLFKNSDNAEVFTSQYDRWKDTIAQEYDIIKGALSYTYGSEMVDHTYLGNELVRVDYDNGVSIYINYDSIDQIVDEITIPAASYVVLEGSR